MLVNRGRMSVLKLTGMAILSVVSWCVSVKGDESLVARERRKSGPVIAAAARSPS
jgi:hypothetical protein